MTPTRSVLEGTWSGYTSAQSRVAHRRVYHIAGWRKLRAWAEKTHAITFTDGTQLYISVRDCAPHERVKQIHGYDSLIDSCRDHGVTSVADLPRRP